MRCHVGNLLFDLPFDVLKRPGSLSELGCSIEDTAVYMKAAEAIAGPRPVMAVAQWQWLEFRYAERDLAEYTRAGLQPIYLWSANVVTDSTGRWQIGDWILSTELIQLHENCIFECKSRVYVMAAYGTTKIIRP